MHLLVTVGCREWDFVTHRIFSFIGEYYHFLERISPVDPAFSCNCTVEICKLIMGHLGCLLDAFCLKAIMISMYISF